MTPKQQWERGQTETEMRNSEMLSFQGLLKEPLQIIILPWTIILQNSKYCTQIQLAEAITQNCRALLPWSANSWRIHLLGWLKTSHKNNVLTTHGSHYLWKFQDNALLLYTLYQIKLSKRLCAATHKAARCLLSKPIATGDGTRQPSDLSSNTWEALRLRSRIFL